MQTAPQVGLLSSGMARTPRGPLTAPESLDSILDRAGESRFARLRPPVAPKVWREAVGARIADRAIPVSLSGGVLLLRVATSVWAHELSLLAETVCTRLRELNVQARELRFQVGAVAASQRPPERRSVRIVPRSPEIPTGLAQVIAAIEDANLKDAIARAAASNLAWQSALGPPTKAESAVSEARRGARAHQSAGPESAPQDRTSPASGAERPRSREAARDRSR